MNKEKSEQNKEYGKLLARWCYECNIDKLPIILNSEQYEAFVKELKELKRMED